MGHSKSGVTRLILVEMESGTFVLANVNAGLVKGCIIFERLYQIRHRLYGIAHACLLTRYKKMKAKDITRDMKKEGIKLGDISE